MQIDSLEEKKISKCHLLEFLASMQNAKKRPRSQIFEKENVKWQFFVVVIVLEKIFYDINILFPVYFC